MFMRHASDFGDWRFSHDVVWEKHNGSSFVNDRFKRVHEVAAHFYRGAWETVYRCPPVTNDARRREVRRKARPPHMGEVGESRYKSEDGGPRLARSVQYVRSCHGSAIHPTQKPTGILRPLIEYATPSGGTVADLFAGSGSLLKAAQQCGRRAIGFETQEKHCEAAARHLAQGELVAS
jgi:site-specific DNA-methyltransferase (adenine-specific)